MHLITSNPIAPGASLQLIISFDKVEYLSSTMLSVLVRINAAVDQQKGKVVLANLDPELMKVFTLMKLDKKMKICKTTDDALSALKK